MHEYLPSRTALGVARRRAVHQLLDNPRVFDDPLAVSIIGPEAAARLASEVSTNEHPVSRSLRAFVAVRSRYAEDELTLAVANGVRQYVVLGAGLDTFACRNIHAAAGLRVFEIDHPSTQEWKRDLLRTAGIAIPAESVFVPVDFERQSLGDGLQAAGFDHRQPAFFSWLGVVPYLTEDAFRATMAYIAAMPPGSGVVFDYGVPRSELNAREQLARDHLAGRVAAAGEPLQLFFEPKKLAAQLRTMGFRHVEDLDAAEINRRYFRDRSDGFALAGNGTHLLSARV
ncbi:MAG: class I SAM-dependent methyltransferase [Acidobacteriia bacterium]|nr:class I SAM-dependent methyltransferase [Terriglobia bacterium]